MKKKIYFFKFSFQLTHIIMQKELKQVQVWEDLDFNSNVKHKTKEYVKKYMGKVGPVYRIKDDTWPMMQAGFSVFW